MGRSLTDQQGVIMQSPTFSRRDKRLESIRKESNHQLEVAQVRLANANRACMDNDDTTAAVFDERDQAATALYEALRWQGQILAAQQRYSNLSDGTLLIVLTDSGEQYVVERRDGSVKPHEHGDWYRLGEQQTRMTFEEAVGTFEFFPIFTTEQVDDMLDRAWVDDLFV